MDPDDELTTVVDRPGRPVVRSATDVMTPTPRRVRQVLIERRWVQVERDDSGVSLVVGGSVRLQMTQAEAIELAKALLEFDE